jgi:hypothetical protein
LSVATGHCRRRHGHQGQTATEERQFHVFKIHPPRKLSKPVRRVQPETNNHSLNQTMLGEVLSIHTNSESEVKLPP